MADFWGREAIEEASKLTRAYECEHCVRIFAAFTYETSRICEHCRELKFTLDLHEKFRESNRQNQWLRERVRILEAANEVSI